MVVRSVSFCISCALAVIALPGGTVVAGGFPVASSGSAVTDSAERHFRIVDYGAVIGGARCTKSIAKAIDACAPSGCGQVIVPAGAWMTGCIRLKSGVELHLEEGAELRFSDNTKDYLPAVLTSFEGVECLNYSPLIYAYCCTNVALCGKGVLRPRMAFWKKLMEEKATDIQDARAILYKWGSEDYPVERRNMPAETLGGSVCRRKS